MFYSLATHPKYWSDKINMFVALSPVGSLQFNDHYLFSSPLIRFGIPFFIKFLAYFEVYYLLGPWVQTSIHVMCYAVPTWCRTTEVAGITKVFFDDDPDRLIAYVGHYPAIVGVKSLIHFWQMLKTPGMRLFDYDPVTNVKKYGQSVPPAVDLGKIRVPVAIFANKDDPLCSLKDAHLVRDSLDSSVLKYYHEGPGGHISFMVGREMAYLDQLQKLVISVANF